MKIKCDIQKSLQQSHDIQEISYRLNQEINKINSLMQDVKVGWKGLTSEAFLKECDSISENISDISTNIKRTGQVMKENSINMKIKEEEQKRVIDSL